MPAISPSACRRSSSCSTAGASASGPDGEVVPIDWGLRLSGKAAEKYNLGVLYMQTDEVLDVAPENDFAVARVSRDLPNRSSIGALVHRRQGSGRQPPRTTTNLTYALDGRWGIGQYGLIEGFVAQTDTPGEEEDEYSYRLGGSYNSETGGTGALHRGRGGLQPGGRLSHPQGLPQAGGFSCDASGRRTCWGLQELRPHISYRATGTSTASRRPASSTSTTTGSGRAATRSTPESTSPARDSRSRSRSSTASSSGPAPTTTPRCRSSSSPTAARPGASERVVAGGFFDGDRVALIPTSPSASARSSAPRSTGSTTTSSSRGRLRDQPGPYADLLLVHAADLRPGSRPVQRRRRDLGHQPPLRLAQRASTGLYVVYNEVRDIGSAGTGIPDRSLTIKYSRMFDLLR